MAPPPLSSTSSPRHLSIFNGAISTATSPLQANFNLSCRSPGRPPQDRASRADGSSPLPSPSLRGSPRVQLQARPAALSTATGQTRTSPAFLELPARHGVLQSSWRSQTTQSPRLSPLSPRRLPAPSERDGSTHTTAITSDDRWSLSDDDELESDDLASARSWLLPQPSPGLPPSGTPSSRRKQDAGKLGVVSAVNIIVGKTIGVGAYTVPSAVFEGVGSVGMALVVWLVGSVISFCGLAVYLDLGTAIPKSGGERVYLERIFRRPRMLATCMFMAYVVLLGFSTPNAIVLGEYVLYALDAQANRWNVRTVAVISVTSLCFIHARYPRLGLRLINVLGVIKMLMFVVVVLSGIAGGLMGVGTDRAVSNNDNGGNVLMGHHLDPDMLSHMPQLSAASDNSHISTARRNFQNIWAGSSSQPYDYATALLKVIYCFRGYSTANQVLSDVRNPVRTLRVAAPTALVMVSVSYLAINVAFFLVVDKDEFKSAGVVVAGMFFRNIFGDGLGAHVLPLFVIISAAGNIAATSFAQARVNEELAKDGLLPFASFWRSNKRGAQRDHGAPAGGTAALGHSRQQMQQMQQQQAWPPTRGLLLHWLVSVAVIVLPPPGKMYNFLVDIGGYPVSVISVAIATGLLYLQNTPSEEWSSPWRAPRSAVVVFASSNCLLLILPWIPPVGGRGESERFASYAYPLTALAVLASGACYWVWWRYCGEGRRSARLLAKSTSMSGVAATTADTASTAATADASTCTGSRRAAASKAQNRNSDKGSEGLEGGGYGYLSPSGWDLLKRAMGGSFSGRSSTSGSSGSSSRDGRDGRDGEGRNSSDSTNAGDGILGESYYGSPGGLVSDDEAGKSEPMIEFSSLRRRAPCGCPSPP